MEKEPNKFESVEFKRQELERLAQDLGFSETTEMRETKLRLAAAEPEEQERLALAWREQAEALADLQKSGADAIKMQIGLSISEAARYLYMNDMEGYQTELSKAMEYAFQMHLDELVEKLKNLT